MHPYNYIIIGASQAGLTAAKTLREEDSLGSILVISEEKYLPYKRTKLSKSLNQKAKKDAFALYPKSWYKENRIELLTGDRVESIDPEKYSLSLKCGRNLEYRKLLIATGARPRRLEIPGGEYIFYLRNRKDLELIQKAMDKASSLLVIGGGVEGIELADQFIKAGKRVTLVTAGSRLMENWLDAPMAEYLEQAMKEAGVNIYFNSPVTSLEPEKGGFQLLCGKDYHYAEMVVASTGINTNKDLIQKTLHCGEKGIQVNLRMETSHTDIYAAGDVLELPSEYSQGLWHAAQLQGEVAAMNMAGVHRELDTRSFRLKCEVFGCYLYSQNYNRCKNISSERFIHRGDRYLRLFIKDDQTIGALMYNIPEKARELQHMVQQMLPAEQIVKKLTQ